MIREPVELLSSEIQTRKWLIYGEVMPIFHHKNYPRLGHSRNTSWKFVCLLVQMPDYFSFFSFIFCAYIMFIYYHIDNEKLKIQKKNQKIEKNWKKNLKKIEKKKENSRKIWIESKISFHDISFHNMSFISHVTWWNTLFQTLS